MNIIAISGKKRSGKDTVAQIIRCAHKDRVLIYKFSAPLKNEVALACAVKTEFIDQFKDNFRLILQGWGTDYRRKLYGDDYWIKKMDSAISMFESYGSVDTLIISDVRFKNEFAYLKKKGAIMLRIERAAVVDDDRHISEIELDNVPHDYTIHNDGSMLDLAEQVKLLKL